MHEAQVPAQGVSEMTTSCSTALSAPLIRMIFDPLRNQAPVFSLPVGVVSAHSLRGSPGFSSQICTPSVGRALAS